MLKRVLLAAILCGLAASLLMSGAQHLRVIPLIAEAESYESGTAHDHGHSHGETTAPAAPAAEPAAEQGHSHDHGHDHAHGSGLERIGLTVTANAATGISFALILTAAGLLLRLPITRENGLIWGFLGFTAFNLAPAIGLPPELPGMPAGDLFARQIWWWQTVIATGGAFLLMAKVKNLAATLAGVALIALPHLIGAPSPVTHESALPPHLASAYAANALASSLLLWVLIGVFLGKHLNLTHKD
jgi:cobalt transporter subunit CbtA